MDVHVPDLAVGLATVLGLGTVIWQLRGQRDAVLGHIRRLMWVAIIFFAARSIAWISEFDLARSVTIAAAAILPLMVLLAVESILRRHAPPWVKIGVASGSVGLAVLGLFPAINILGFYILALVVFQVVAFALIIWRLLTRRRDTLSPGENTTIDQICLGLLIMLPLLVSDYRFDDWPIPASMSGIAVLISCWILVHLSERSFNRRRMTGELILLLSLSAVAALFVHIHTQSTWFAGVQIWVILFALSLAAAVIVGCLRLRWRSLTQRTIARGLRGPADAQMYLAELQKSGLTERILGPDLLSDFDATTLAEAFDQDGAASLADLPKNAETDTMGQSQLRALFARSGTTQAYLATRAPLRIAVGQRHGMSAGPDPELLAAFGLSRLMADRVSKEDQE